MPNRPFGEYRETGHTWVTIFDSPFYPDGLEAARVTYQPVLETFTELATDAVSTQELLREIQRQPADIRVQLLRIFRKYASPDTAVEMLKHVRKTDEIIERFGDRFRMIELVRANLQVRPQPDEALFAVLQEHANRGQKGYALTEAFFLWFEGEFTDLGLTIDGPTGAGRDIELRDVLDDYPTATPADFVVRDDQGKVRVIGFARYDSDRGGSQEDDRVSGNERRLREILAYAEKTGASLKVVFLNDGPGLLLGSMWRDYATLEDGGLERALVTTLKLAQAGRLTADWMTS